MKYTCKYFLPVMLLVLLASCAGAPAAVSFYEKNSTEFSYFTLDNGIPVVLKQSGGNRLINLQLVVKGGLSCTVPGAEGEESAVFNLMSYGSAGYTYEQISALCYTKQASLSARIEGDYSVFELNCIDYYFDTLFPVFADCFLHPVFQQEQFDLMINEYHQSLQSSLTDPFSLLQRNMKKEVYKNHPYAACVLNDRDIDRLSPEKLAGHHAQLLNASRISIVAVGAVKPQKLQAALNAAFGSLPATAFPYPEIPAPVFTGKPHTDTTATAEQTAYAAKVFPIPPANTPEYAAFALAAQIYDDILFNIVREKYGSCYSIGNGAESAASKAPYGMMYIFKASNTKDIPAYLAEADGVMRRGNVISSKNGGAGSSDGYIELPLAERLEGYKNSYINSIYSRLQTSAGTASRIVSGYMQHNDPLRYLQMIDFIRAVSVDDITAAYTAIWHNPQSRWFFVSDSAGISRIPLGAYR